MDNFKIILIVFELNNISARSNKLYALNVLKHGFGKHSNKCIAPYPSDYT